MRFFVEVSFVKANFVRVRFVREMLTLTSRIKLFITVFPYTKDSMSHRQMTLFQLRMM